jgi:hypothetical protein
LWHGVGLGNAHQGRPDVQWLPGLESRGHEAMPVLRKTNGLIENDRASIRTINFFPSFY